MSLKHSNVAAPSFAKTVTSYRWALILVTCLFKGLRTEAGAGVHDHEQSRTQAPDLHVEHAVLAQVVADLRPDLLMQTFVLGNQCQVVDQVQRQALAVHVSARSRWV